MINFGIIIKPFSFNHFSCLRPCRLGRRPLGSGRETQHERAHLRPRRWPGPSTGRLVRYRLVIIYCPNSSPSVIHLFFPFLYFFDFTVRVLLLNDAIITTTTAIELKIPIIIDWFYSIMGAFVVFIVDQCARHTPYMHRLSQLSFGHSKKTVQTSFLFAIRAASCYLLFRLTNNYCSRCMCTSQVHIRSIRLVQASQTLTPP